MKGGLERREAAYPPPRLRDAPAHREAGPSSRRQVAPANQPHVILLGRQFKVRCDNESSSSPAKLRRMAGGMFIYVSGPYSAPPGTAVERQRVVKSNVEKANRVGIAIVAKGHTPLVPHTMMFGWEDRDGVPREDAMRVCREWVTRCDALFRIGSSPGADAEFAVARRHQLVVFRDLDEIPLLTE